LVLAALVVSVAAVVVRFARSVGEERLQLKWFAAAAVLVLVLLAVTGWLNSAVADVLIDLAFLCLWVAIGVAVLKYRLYDIDIVISKAVLYGSLAVFITAVYAALVVGVGTLAGGRDRPLLAAGGGGGGGGVPAGAPVGRAAGQPSRVRPARYPVSGAVGLRPAHRRHLLSRGRATADGAHRGGGHRRRAGRDMAAGR
jgi:hypothetical protein